MNIKLLILTLLFPFILFSNDKLTIVKVEESVVTDIAFSILKEAYTKIGIDVKDKLVPAKRALLGTNSGYYDGELIRIKGIDKKYENLRMITIPLLKVKGGVIFSKNKDFLVKSWDDLKPYKLGFQSGLVLATKKTEGFNREMVWRNEQLFHMLDNGSIDIVYSGLLTGQSFINRLKIKDVKVLDNPLVEVDVFHYLHKKHESLVPKLNEVLSNMQKSGRIELIKRNILNK